MFDPIKVLYLEDLLLEEKLIHVNIKNEFGEGVLILIISLKGAPLIGDKLQGIPVIT